MKPTQQAEFDAMAKRGTIEYTLELESEIERLKADASKEYVRGLEDALKAAEGLSPEWRETKTVDDIATAIRALISQHSAQK